LGNYLDEMDGVDGVDRAWKPLEAYSQGADLLLAPRVALWCQRGAMSGRLSHRQHGRLLEAIQQLQRCRSLEAFPAVVNRLFRDLIECDSVSYNDVYREMDRTVFRLDPAPPRVEEFAEKWKRHGHQHPMVNYARETGDGSAHQFSDFLSRRQYHALDLYQDCFRELGVEHQLSISVSASENVLVGVAMNRERCGFSETERLMANLLRPHVSEAYLTLIELGHLRGMVDDLASALDEKGEGSVFWSHQGVVLHASPRARELLAAVFGWRNGRALPDALAKWARERAGGPGEGIFACENAGRRLVARLARQSAFHYVTIVIHEEATALDPALLVPLGVSKREAEILAWLAAGKSNAEIASIVGVSPLTAKTHVLNILRKLGVENRTTAAVMVHEFLKSRGGWR
jgi:DNA-binding CsgD family transcriptional regulator